MPIDDLECVPACNENIVIVHITRKIRDTKTNVQFHETGTGPDIETQQE